MVETMAGLADRSVALVGQMTPGAASVGVIGLFAGLVTAVGGIALQAYDRSNLRRKVDLDHQYRLEIARRSCDELCTYSKSAYAYICVVRKLCQDADINLPPEPGPPPSMPPCFTPNPDESQLSTPRPVGN